MSASTPEGSQVFTLVLTDYGPLVLVPDGVPVEQARKFLTEFGEWVAKNREWDTSEENSRVLAIYESNIRIQDLRTPKDAAGSEQ